MKSLYESILDNDKIDGHVHLFDHNGIIDSSLVDTSKRCVCFSDVAFRYLDNYKGDHMIDIYDEFINNYYDSSKHILLATGENSKDIISIYEKYPNIIRGFGELKCYDSYKDLSLPYSNLEWIEPLLKFNCNIGLPVYIHYELNSDERIKKLENLLNTYKFPIVLCHCGMTDNHKRNKQIYDCIKKLMQKYSNFYVDISECKSREFFINDVKKILDLDNNRLIIGTDINPECKNVLDDPIGFSKKCYDQFYLIHRFANYNSAIKKLFNK